MERNHVEHGYVTITFLFSWNTQNYSFKNNLKSISLLYIKDTYFPFMKACIKYENVTL